MAEDAKSRLQFSQELREIGDELRCPTCQGVSILESDTPQSVAMRREIERQMNEGKKKDEIIRFFRDRYGEWILRKPDSDSAVGKMIWVIPSVGLVLGPVVLVWAIRTSRRRELLERETIEKELRAFIESRRLKGEQV